jgi:Fe-S cluster assembly protein SufD
MAKFTREAVEQLSAHLDEPQWMLDFRLKAFDLYQSLPMPTLKDEAWRRTDIRALQLNSIGPSINGHSAGTAGPQSVELEHETAGSMLLVDGERISYHLDPAAEADGVVFLDMNAALQSHGDLLREYFMTRVVKPEEGKFAALHAAFWRGGTFLYVPAGVTVAAPFHSLAWNLSGRTFGHILIIVEKGASATLANEFMSETGDKQALHNGVVELIVKESARLQYLSLQEWGRDLWQFTHERASVGKDAELDWVIGVLGSQLTKSFQTVDLDGRGATARMSGLYFGLGRQHLDLDTEQNHNQPDTVSDLLYKGALKSGARSVWQGMIRVLPDAQRTNGYQANRNLLLTKNARADSIPGLEIEADDVRCTHGSTVGQVDEDEIFYLMSRGLPREDAVQLLVSGFFTPVLDRIPLEVVRNRLQRAIEERV